MASPVSFVMHAAGLGTHAASISSVGAEEALGLARRPRPLNRRQPKIRSSYILQGKNIEVVHVLASYRRSVQGLARKEDIYCSGLLNGKTPRSLVYRVAMADKEILDFVWGMANNG
jgi:hypothetical protein